MSSSKTRRIVVVGGGVAGAHCVRALQRGRCSAELDVTLIDRRCHFQFASLSGAGAPPGNRQGTVPLRSFIGDATRLCMGEVVGIDRASSHVVLVLPDGGGRRRLAFDQLVVSVGRSARWPSIPGLREFGVAVGSPLNVGALQRHAMQMLALANETTNGWARRALPHVVVVGGNPAGVELAGEVALFLRDASRRFPRVHTQACRVTLIERGARILEGLDRQTSALSTTILRGRGIDVRPHSSISRVQRDGVRLSDGMWLATRTVLWCPEIVPSQSVAGFGLPMDADGHLLCHPDMRVRDQRNIWSIGGCAVNVDPDGRAYPATVQNAIRQGRQLAHNLMRAVVGESTRPCRGQTRETQVTLGGHSGIAPVLGLKTSGLLGWFIGRISLLMMVPGLAHKVRLLFHYAASVLIPRTQRELGARSEDDEWSTSTSWAGQIAASTAVLSHAGKKATAAHRKPRPRTAAR